MMVCNLCSGGRKNEWTIEAVSADLELLMRSFTDFCNMRIDARVLNAF